MSQQEDRQAWLGQYGALVGIHWADETHVVHLAEVDSGVSQTVPLRQSPEEISTWVLELHKRLGGRRFAVCLEQKKGSLIAALMKYEFIDLYPLNPKRLKSYREAFTTSGAVDDPTDATLLYRYLHTNGHRMKVWRPDTEETRLLVELTHDRREEVSERTRHTNQLESRLKSFYPLVLELLGENLHSPLACQVLRRWPTLEALQKARPSSVRKVFARHGKLSAEALDDLLRRIREAMPLTTDRALVESGSLRVQQLVRRIHDLNESVAEFDHQIAQVMDKHPEADFYTALPGAGEVMAPRLLAAMGTDRER